MTNDFPGPFARRYETHLKHLKLGDGSGPLPQQPATQGRRRGSGGAANPFAPARPPAARRSRHVGGDARSPSAPLADQEGLSLQPPGAGQGASRQKSKRGADLGCCPGANEHSSQQKCCQQDPFLLFRFRDAEHNDA